MGILSNIFSSGASELVKEVGAAVDNLVTSDEERLLLKNELNKIASESQIKNKELDLKFAQVTAEQWKSDNEAAITRLVRPVAYLLIISLFILIVLFDGNLGSFKINIAYVPVIEGLMQTMTVAYFGLRTGEKITKFIKSSK